MPEDMPAPHDAEVIEEMRRQEELRVLQDEERSLLAEARPTPTSIPTKEQYAEMRHYHRRQPTGLTTLF
jgi:hypothetical protein